MTRTPTGSHARCSTGGSPTPALPSSATPRSSLIQRRIDMDLFVVSLHRLHTVAELAAAVADARNVLSGALERFSGQTGGLPLSESEPAQPTTIASVRNALSTGRAWLSEAASAWPAARTADGSATATACSRQRTCSPAGATTTIALVPAKEDAPAGVETGIRFRTHDADADNAELRSRGVDVGDVLRWPGARRCSCSAIKMATVLRSSNRPSAGQRERSAGSLAPGAAQGRKS